MPPIDTNSAWTRSQTTLPIGKRIVDWQRSPRRSYPVGYFRLFSALVMSVVLLLGWGALVWVGLWYAPPRPVAVVLIGAGYEENLTLPHNVYGWRTLTRLATPTSRILLPVGPPHRLKVGDQLARLIPQHPATAIVIYLALHGASDPEGAYLLPDDASTATEPQQRIRLAELLFEIAKLPEQQVKILVLDATQPRSDWSRGALRNDFARALAELEDIIVGIPNLVVISSSRADEQSWSSPEFGETTFGYYFRQALNGHAQDDNRDNFIHLDEAFHWTTEQVRRWAEVNRGVSQRPILYPSGTEGQRRCRRVVLGPHRVLVSEAPPPPADLPEELLNAWREVEELAATVPPPEVYAPSLWHRYLETVLRVESLIEANDFESAQRLLSLTHLLQSQIRNASILHLESLGNSTTVPSLAGFPTAADDSARNLALTLSAASPATAAKVWQSHVEALGPDPIASIRLRLQVERLLLEYAATDRRFRTERFPGLFRLLESSGRPPPVEGQFALLLERDLATPSPPEELIETALRCRILAEEAAVGISLLSPIHSERLWPIVKPGLAAADALRLEAQDRLLSNDPQQWRLAREKFAEATQIYQASLQKAGTVTFALAVRDRGLSRLSYLSRFYANQLLPLEPQLQQSLNETVAAIGDLFDNLHRLDQEIRSQGSTSPEEAWFARVEQLSRNCDQNLRALTEHFFTDCRQLADTILPSVWRDADDALRFPLIPVELRIRLLKNKRAQSWRFLLESRGDSPEAIAEAVLAQRSSNAAMRQGLLALSQLGEANYATLAEASGENWNLTRQRILTFTAEASGWRSLQTASASIASRLAAAPRRIEAALDQADALEGDAPLGPLAQADSLIRILPIGEVLAIRSDPVGRCRLAWLSQQLLHLAERTWQEHWYAVDPKQEPYFRRAGLLYAADAKREGDPRRLSAVSSLLMASGELELRFSPEEVPTIVTSESSITITANLVAKEGAKIPPGLAVWLPQPGLGLTTKVTPSLWQPTVVGSPAKPLQVPLNNANVEAMEREPPATPTPLRSELQMQAKFRGQQIQARLPVTIYPRPVVEVRQYPKPERASLAVRADAEILQKYGRASGSVVFVLDCSGSMGVPVGETFGPRAKFAEAVTALETVLRDLPEGTRVSLWAFGQASGAAMTEPIAEKTIKRIIPPTIWNPRDPMQLPSVLEKVRYPALVPWNESPVLRAMFEAKSDFQDVRDSKTLVVITDGLDNRFHKDAVINPKRLPFPDVLRSEFLGTGITVHVIGFRLPAAESAEVRKQFEVVTSLEPPGTYSTTETAEELGQAIRRALPQNLRYWIENFANELVPGLSRQGCEVGRSGGGERWFLPGLSPGAYKLRLRDRPDLVQEVQLERSDRLLMKLRDSRSGLRLERAAWTIDDFPNRPWQAARDWRATLLQNQRLGNGFEGFLALERTYSARETVLQQPQPRTVWLELHAADLPEEALATEWYELPGYPASTWAIASPAWPDSANATARPELKVWWNPDQELVVADRLRRGIDFRSLEELQNRRLFIEGQPVWLQSIAVESHTLATRPREREQVSCLTLRLRHDPQQAVQVQIRGLDYRGQALWRYPSVGRTTIHFWGVDSQSLQVLEAVDLISVRSFCRDAERRGYHLQFSGLPAPDPADQRPQPPLPLP